MVLMAVDLRMQAIWEQIVSGIQHHSAPSRNACGAV